MAKTIEFDYKNNHYILEFNRSSVKSMEQNGFRIEDIESKPMSTLPTLFAGAFMMHHRYLKQDVIDDIFAHLTNKAELIIKLGEMYSEPINALVDEPTGDEGNLSWGASW